MRKLTVALLNDSFPPTIDGVASVVLNYAKTLQKSHGKAVVATPWYPDAEDNYDFDVVRYLSSSLGKRIGYRAGYPFDPVAVKHLEKYNPDIIHTHCPFASAILARVLRYYTGAPLVFTYHTKFDIDLKKRLAIAPMRGVSRAFLVNNINACDEVWVVSEGAGQNLRSLGYNGNYIVMENGTDFAKGRAPQEAVDKLSAQYNLDPQVPVFLFVGRMMWYKGVKHSIDALKVVKAAGQPFKMFFVGDGYDRADITAYAAQCGLEQECVFTGAIKDREELRTYFSRANLFLFPSTYDTNGIVVKEAAACACPSLLVARSCASEGIAHGETGILAAENGESIGNAILNCVKDLNRLAQIGENAAEKIYLSWDDAIARAHDRYEYIIENYKKQNHPMPAGQLLFKSARGVRHTYRRATRKIKRTVKDLFEPEE